MIKDIQVCSRATINQILDSQKPRPSESDWSLISIHGTLASSPIKGYQEILKRLGCLHTCTARFTDVTLEEYETRLKQYRSAYRHIFLFNEKIACRLINFIKRVNSFKKDNTLVIHCEQGISRSAAVGVFACTYLGLDTDEFIKKNPQIRPNPFVLYILSETAKGQF